MATFVFLWFGGDTFYSTPGNALEVAVHNYTEGVLWSLLFLILLFIPPHPSLCPCIQYTYSYTTLYTYTYMHFIHSKW